MENEIKIIEIAGNKYVQTPDDELIEIKENQEARIKEITEGREDALKSIENLKYQFKFDNLQKIGCVKQQSNGACVVNEELLDALIEVSFLNKNDVMNAVNKINLLVLKIGSYDIQQSGYHDPKNAIERNQYRTDKLFKEITESEEILNKINNNIDFEKLLEDGLIETATLGSGRTYLKVTQKATEKDTQIFSESQIDSLEEIIKKKIAASNRNMSAEEVNKEYGRLARWYHSKILKHILDAHSYGQARISNNKEELEYFKKAGYMPKGMQQESKVERVSAEEIEQTKEENPKDFPPELEANTMYKKIDPEMLKAYQDQHGSNN